MKPYDVEMTMMPDDGSRYGRHMSLAFCLVNTLTKLKGNVIVDYIDKVEIRTHTDERRERERANHATNQPTNKSTNHLYSNRNVYARERSKHVNHVLRHIHFRGILVSFEVSLRGENSANISNISSPLPLLLPQSSIIHIFIQRCVCSCRVVLSSCVERITFHRIPRLRLLPLLLFPIKLE